MIIAVVGGAGLFYIESQLPDNEMVNRDVNAQLMKVDNLHSSINELSLRSRANLDSNYDMLVRNTVALERSVADLADGHFNKNEIAGSLLESRFDRFRERMTIKIDNIEDFKSANSVLRNSEKYTPLVGAQLSDVARENELSEISDLYRKIVIDVLDFTKQGSDRPVADVSEYSQQIRASEPQLPAEHSVKVLEFANHVATAIDAKQKADRYLNNVLNSSANDQIEELLNAWGQWQAENNNTQELLRYYTLGYVLAILALIGILVFRLRNLYTNLDSQVEQKADEARLAYEELQASERQLVQSEKMASLGQLVAGVAHEINTPLSYITSNLDTIKARFDRLGPVIGKAAAISDTLSDPNRDKNAINNLLKEQIVAYRSAGKNNKPDKLNVLLNDASDGLQEIKQIVDTLTNYSHVQDAPAQDVDVNECINNTLKVISNSLGERQVTLDCSDELPPVKGVPNQLAQVFTNIITNAAHATDANSGTVTIKTEEEQHFVKVTISDNGRGIDPDALKRVLEPFFTTKEVGEGTGLGLSIAHRLIEAHEGELTIDSELGAGTKVTVRLPLTEQK